MDGDSREFQASVNVRPAPHNYEAERALLGGILANNQAYERVSEFLKEEHFADPVNGKIFGVIAQHIDRNEVVDPVTLKQLFEHDGTLADVGGIRYLADLAASMVSIINVGDYGRIIRELHQKRQLLGLGEQTIEGVYQPEVQISEQIAAIESGIATITESNTLGIPSDPDSQIQRTLENIEAASKGQAIGRKSGLAALDRIIGGFKPGKLYVIGARPGTGKSSLLVGFADCGGEAWIYSGEMPAEEWHARRLAIASGIPSHRYDTAIHPAEFDKVYLASKGLDRSVWIDDTPALTMEAIRRRARRHADKHPVSLIGIDHLGKVQPRDLRAPQVMQLGEITGAAKNLAKEMGVAVVLLVQLNRLVEQRDDKRPQIADIRGSGNVEEDADVIGFLYREAAYLQKYPPVKKPNESDGAFLVRQAEHEERLKEVKNLGEIAIAKQRGGPEGLARIYWTPELMQFGDLMQYDRYDSGAERML